MFKSSNLKITISDILNPQNLKFPLVAHSWNFIFIFFILTTIKIKLSPKKNNHVTVELLFLLKCLGTNKKKQRNKTHNHY